MIELLRKFGKKRKQFRLMIGGYKYDKTPQHAEMITKSAIEHRAASIPAAIRNLLDKEYAYPKLLKVYGSHGSFGTVARIPWVAVMEHVIGKCSVRYQNNIALFFHDTFEDEKGIPNDSDFWKKVTLGLCVPTLGDDQNSLDGKIPYVLGKVELARRRLRALEDKNIPRSWWEEFTCESFDLGAQNILGRHYEASIITGVTFDTHVAEEDWLKHKIELLIQALSLLNQVLPPEPNASSTKKLYSLTIEG